ncbi:ComF family protein [bacterium]|nr:ComF family protein [bacterium]
MNACLICGNKVENKYFLCDTCNNFALKCERRCPKCGNFILTNEEKNCYSCRGRKIYFDKIYSLFIYSGAVSQLISEMKYGKAAHIAEILGEYLAENAPQQLVKERTVIFPPMRFFDKLLRSFNQAEIFADRVARKHNLKFAPKLLKKVRKTKHQAGLGYEERIRNLTDAFSLTRNVKGEKFLIVDDVCTTASTINEIAKILKENGALSVNGITFARRTPYFA